MNRLELKIPPFVLASITALLMWLIALTSPELSFTLPASQIIASAMAVVSLIVLVLAVFAFHHARTSVNPLKPGQSAALVSTGVYRFSRNPMYLAALLLLVAWAIHLSNFLAFVVLPVFVLYMNRFQISVEE